MKNTALFKNEVPNARKNLIFYAVCTIAFNAYKKRLHKKWDFLKPHPFSHVVKATLCHKTIILLPLNADAIPCVFRVPLFAGLWPSS
jgi:hypothetical protein